MTPPKKKPETQTKTQTKKKRAIATRPPRGRSTPEQMAAVDEWCMGERTPAPDPATVALLHERVEAELRNGRAHAVLATAAQLVREVFPHVARKRLTAYTAALGTVGGDLSARARGYEKVRSSHLILDRVTWEVGFALRTLVRQDGSEAGGTWPAEVVEALVAVARAWAFAATTGPWNREEYATTLASVLGKIRARFDKEAELAAKVAELVRERPELREALTPLVRSTRGEGAPANPADAMRREFKRVLMNPPGGRIQTVRHLQEEFDRLFPPSS